MCLWRFVISQTAAIFITIIHEQHMMVRRLRSPHCAHGFFLCLPIATRSPSFLLLHSSIYVGIHGGHDCSCCDQCCLCHRCVINDATDELSCLFKAYLLGASFASDPPLHLSLFRCRHQHHANFALHSTKIGWLLQLPWSPRLYHHLLSWLCAISGWNDPACPCHAYRSCNTYGHSLLRPAPKKEFIVACSHSPHLHPMTQKWGWPWSSRSCCLDVTLW